MHLPAEVLRRNVGGFDTPTANCVALACQRASGMVRDVLKEVWEGMTVVLQEDVQLGRIQWAGAGWSVLLGSVERLLEGAS